jgi:hypothetical protein
MTRAPAVLLGAPARRQPQPGLDLRRARGVEEHVVDPPLAREAREPTLGDDGDERRRDARGADDPAQRLGHGELAPGVDEDGVGRRCVHQGGRLGGKDANMVTQQAQRRDHLGAGRQGVRQ